MQWKPKRCLILAVLKKELKAKVRRYNSLTSRALKKAKICVPKSSYLHGVALDYKQMAGSYFDDASHFEKKGDLLLALASLSYAHAWLDAGARLGVFDVKGDDKLFTLYK